MMQKEGILTVYYGKIFKHHWCCVLDGLFIKFPTEVIFKINVLIVQEPSQDYRIAEKFSLLWATVSYFQQNDSQQLFGFTFKSTIGKKIDFFTETKEEMLEWLIALQSHIQSLAFDYEKIIYWKAPEQHETVNIFIDDEQNENTDDQNDIELQNLNLNAVSFVNNKKEVQSEVKKNDLKVEELG